MFGKPARGRRFAPALGVALLAMLAFGAVMASAAGASTWHIDQKAFSGEESTAWEGEPLEFTNEGWGATIICNSVYGEGQIEEKDRSSGTLTIDECEVDELPECTVEPLSLSFDGQLVDSGRYAYELYEVSGDWTFTGSCWLEGIHAVEGSIAAKLGEEAVESTREFNVAAEKATEATGLQFYGDPWKVSGDATVVLVGSNYGKPFGNGDLPEIWEPEAAATWTIGGEAFTGWASAPWGEELWEETFEIESSSGTIACSGIFTVGSSWIDDWDKSHAEVVLHECGFSQPECEVGGVLLEMTGQAGRVGPYYLEKMELGGEAEMTGSGCPFEGTKPVSGNVGAALVPEGEALLKGFNEWTNEMTGATGMELNGETWSINEAAGYVRLGNTKYEGKELGVE